MKFVKKVDVNLGHLSSKILTDWLLVVRLAIFFVDKHPIACLFIVFKLPYTISI